MTREEIKSTADELREFISRASKKEARPEEISVLPSVVEALIRLENINFIAD